MRLASIAFPALICSGVLWFAPADAQSLRFVGNGDDDFDRVTIEVGNDQPANIGAVDFTIEFWLRAGSGNNQPAVNCNSTGYNWTEGNIVLDRDRLPNNYRDFGLSIAGGRVVFGVEPTAGNAYTICSDSTVLDGAWHHIAVQRQSSDGRLWVYVDGVLERQADGPNGTLSYPAGANELDPRESLLVLGAEKYDLDTTAFPGFRGWIDELRISNRLQYPQNGNFTPATTPFDCTNGAVALYHFDEGTGNAVSDACSNQSPATRQFGGSPQGPEWRTETPFSSTPSAGTVQFTAATFTVLENTATLGVTVSRASGSTGAASVNVDLNGGSAILNSDFSISAAPLSWSNGQAGDRTFTITLVNDALVEGAETIELLLADETGATIGTPSSATVTITDDDQAQPPPPPPPPPPAPPAPPTTPSGNGGGGGSVGWVLLLIAACAAVLRRCCRLPLHPP